MRNFWKKDRGFTLVELILSVPVLIIAVLLIVGEIKCIYKAVNCDWEAPYKAEVLYTGSAFCGLGAIVGWIDIEDGPKK